MVIIHNMEAMNSQRQYSITGTNKRKSAEKLSSGYRINRAADDAAGLAISEKMRRQIRGLNQGALNVQDGISLLQVADGALNEVHDMLQRMNELSVQAANDTNTLEDRKYIQEEIDQIKEEIGRIGDTTSFNTIFLFKGVTETKPVINGYKDTNISGISYTNLEEISDDVFRVTIEFDNVVSSSGNPKVTLDGNDYTISQKYSNLVNQIAREEITGSNMTGFSYNYNLIINPQIYGEKQCWGEVINNKINIVEEGNWYHHNESGFYRTIGDVRYKNTSSLSGGWIEFNVDMNNLPCLKDANGEETRITVGFRNNLDRTRNDYICIEDSNNDGIDDEKPNMITIDKYIDTIKKQLTINNSNEDKMDAIVELVAQSNQNEKFSWTFEVTKPEEIEDYKEYTYNMEFWIQSGSEIDDGLYLSIPHMDEAVIGVKNVRVLSGALARAAITKISDAIEIISQARSQIGAQQNRLEHTFKNVTNIAENTQASESLIRDTDMAKEMVENSKLGIFEQVGATIMAQANQTKQGVLKLLQ